MALDVYKEWLGIPDGPRPPDHYQLLRLVSFEDSAEKIRGNYKKLNAHVRKYATGTYSNESQELLNELAKAMLCLTDAERKLEYDKGLGRVVKEDYGLFGRKPMEVLLLEREVLSPAQGEEARQYSKKSGLDMRDTLVQLKIVEPAVAAEALAEELGIPYMDLADMIPDDSVLDKVPRNVVKRNSILPLFEDDGKMLVASVHPPTTELEEELQLRFGIPARFVLTTPLAINQGIAKYYAPGMRAEVEESAGKRIGAGIALPAMKRASELTADELKQRQQLGMVFICWSIIGSVLIDQYVLPSKMLIGKIALLAFFIPPITIAWVWKFYWGK